MTCGHFTLIFRSRTSQRLQVFPSICPYLSVSAADALAVGAEGSHEVGGGEKAVLVSIHDTESLLELLDGGVGERFKDVCFLRHFE